MYARTTPSGRTENRPRAAVLPASGTGGPQSASTARSRAAAPGTQVVPVLMTHRNPTDVLASLGRFGIQKTRRDNPWVGGALEPSEPPLPSGPSMDPLAARSLVAAWKQGRPMAAASTSHRCTARADGSVTCSGPVASLLQQLPEGAVARPAADLPEVKRLQTAMGTLGSFAASTNAQGNQSTQATGSRVAEKALLVASAASRGPRVLQLGADFAVQRAFRDLVHRTAAAQRSWRDDATCRASGGITHFPVLLQVLWPSAGV